MNRLLFISFLLLGCSGKATDGFVPGVYVCASCEYPSMDFRDGGKLIITSKGGVSIESEYSVAGNKVEIEGETATYTFTITAHKELQGEGYMEGTYRLKP